MASIPLEDEITQLAGGAPPVQDGPAAGAQPAQNKLATKPNGDPLGFDGWVTSVYGNIPPDTSIDPIAWRKKYFDYRAGAWEQQTGGFSGRFTPAGSAALRRMSRSINAMTTLSSITKTFKDGTNFLKALTSFANENMRSLGYDPYNLPRELTDKKGNLKLTPNVMLRLARLSPEIATALFIYQSEIAKSVTQAAGLPSGAMFDDGTGGAGGASASAPGRTRPANGRGVLPKRSPGDFTRFQVGPAVQSQLPQRRTLPDLAANGTNGAQARPTTQFRQVRTLNGVQYGRNSDGEQWQRIQ